MNIANNLETTEEGYALDARQGKILNSKLPKILHGTASTTNMNGYFRKAMVTFPEAFSEKPGIMITAIVTDKFSTIDVRVTASLLNVSKTGFTAVVQDIEGQLEYQGYNIAWVAVGI